MRLLATSTPACGVRKISEGKEVGVWSHTLTPGVWQQGILEHEHGVDLAKVTWVVNDEEHVGQCHDDIPANVIRNIGANLSTMLMEGELPGGLSVRTESPYVRPLIADQETAEFKHY
jgi:4,5-dihydroxyphthalate decarboxylase